VPALPALLSGAAWTPDAAQPAREVSGEMPLENMVVRVEAPAASGVLYSTRSAFLRPAAIPASAGVTYQHSSKLRVAMSNPTAPVANGRDVCPRWNLCLGVVPWPTRPRGSQHGSHQRNHQASGQ
jgi:hypothetical protein